jgi:lysophospholipase L1-like esterase
MVIMPLGDSITQGAAGTDSNGYRREVNNLLTQSGCGVDFLGSMNDGNLDFDRTHEGHGGWQAIGGAAGGIGVHIYGWLVTKPADVILLHIGTNDTSDGSQNPQDVAYLLDEINRYGTGKTVVLALIINRRIYSTETSAFNDEVRIMAEARIAADDKIVLVDTEPVLEYAADMADSVHPNDSGYLKMAEK